MEVTCKISIDMPHMHTYWVCPLHDLSDVIYTDMHSVHFYGPTRIKDIVFEGK